MRMLLMRVLPTIVTILALTGAYCAPALAAERTPPGSYLIYRVTTVGELRSQVANSALVRSRYSHHFGVSAEDLDKYFGANLTLVALKQPLRVQCWYIDKAGNTSVKSKLLPRGTMVFAAKSGEPLLSWSCGNPLSAELPTKVAMKPLLEVKATPPTVETKVLANPVETISTAVVTAPPATELTSVLPIESPPVLTSIAAPAVSMPPVILSNGGGGGAGLLGALGGLGALAAGLGGGGGGGGGVGTVIPEPSSLTTLASCLAMMPIALGFRRRRR
jgi:hypothetical protein